MTLPPQNLVQANGITQASDAYLNTLVQWVPNVATLRTFSGIGTMAIELLGTSSLNDGGQGFFYWNSAGTAADDNGATTVVPTGNTTGNWTRLNTYGIPAATPFVAQIHPYLNTAANAPGGFNSGWPASLGGGIPVGGHNLQYLDGNNYEHADARQIISDDPTGIYQHTITAIANNGSGLIRLTITPAIPAAETSLGFITGSIAAVGQVNGTTEANGIWTITVVNSTTIDLQGSTFVNAYVSGGYIFGGPLDLAPYISVTRCVPNRLPIFFDAIGGFLFQGQTTQHYNTGPMPYGAILSFIIDPSETQTNAQGMLAIGVDSTISSARNFQAAFAVMQGQIGLGAGYQLPEGLSPTQANFQFCDKGFGTINMLTGYWAANAPIGQAPAGSFKNLVIKNNAVSPNSKIDVTADAVSLNGGLASATAGKVTMQSVTTVYNVNGTIDTTTVGANGLDAGSLANSTWYSIWVIYNTTTNTQALLASLSATGPTMPSGYVFKARIGWMITNSSAQFLRTKQQGRWAQYTLVAASNTTVLPLIDSGVQGTPTGAVSWHSASVTGVVPTTASAIRVVAGAAGGVASDVLIAAPNNAFGAFASSPAPPIQVAIGTGGGGASSEWELESNNVYYACSLASGKLSCLGWEDNI